MDINLLVPINFLGYGVASQNILYTLMDAGHRAAVFPIGPSEFPESKRGVVQAALNNAKLFNSSAPSVRIWHQNQMAEHVGRGVRAGLSFFEMDRFTDDEAHHLGSLDVILSPSSWGASIVENDIRMHGKKVAVVPMGVDRSIFHENIPITRLESDHTVFANVGKFEIRKGHDFLLKCFCKAFRPTDKVVLKMLSHNPFIGAGNEAWKRMYFSSPMGAKIEILPRLTSQESVAKLMAEVDCGVYPARAEGWNLDLLETLSVGTHAIATNYSAHTEYVDANNCRLIQVEDTEPANDGLWFKGQGNWAKLGSEQEEQLIHHLREVHRLKQTGQLARNVAGIETAKRFSWTETANAIIRAIT